MRSPPELPSHLEIPPEVRERLDRIAARPVVLEVDGLGKRYESHEGSFIALKDMAFEVRQREFICVVGRSGCGKSTLIRIIAGLEEPTSGEVRLDGHPVSGPGPDRGMVFQSYTLFPWLTVRENIAFGLRMQGRVRIEANLEAMKWIERVGLKGFQNHYPAQLSGGMRQRVAIARALANRPRILLMDEPFGALDAQTRVRMQSHLLQVWRKVEVTVLFITHDLDEAIYLADRVVVLGSHPGRVLEIVDVPIPRPRHPDQLLDPSFLATRKHLERLIHPADEEDGESLELSIGSGGVEDAAYA
jgi:NitT/TauT family transport system ATP-binding protein